MNVAFASLLVLALTSGDASAATAVTQRLSIGGCADSASIVCPPITRWRSAVNAAMTVRIVAEISNHSSLESDYFVLAAADLVVAPRSGLTPGDFERFKTGNAIAWGQLTSDSDMTAVIVRGLRR